MRPFQLLARRERFEFPGFGIKSRCPLRLYRDPSTNAPIALFFHTWEPGCGTSIVNAFESAATTLYRELGCPKSTLFYLRVERSPGPTPAVAQPYYRNMRFTIGSERRTIEDPLPFGRDLTLLEGNRLFGLSSSRR